MFFNLYLDALSRCFCPFLSKETGNLPMVCTSELRFPPGVPDLSITPSGVRSQVAGLRDTMPQSWASVRIPLVPS